MSQQKPISRPWQVATITGSIWGAFEIVAGSLLHNLAVPMVAGTILSAIGVVIMVTGARLYGEKGIFWRSALVCAALKTVSPSPVILSPMLGIGLEGLLMELGVLLLGNNIVGYVLGGGLALVSILGFKFVRLIMIYGTDLVEAYKSVFGFAFSTNSLSILPVAILVVIFLAIGAFAAYSGYLGATRIKLRMQELPLLNITLSTDGYKPTTKKLQYKGGLLFLGFHIVWLAAFIALKDTVTSPLWISAGVAYLLLCFFRYGRIRVMISRPKFALAILAVSIVSSVLISFTESNAASTLQQITIYALTIFVRALVVLVSFTCIGIEIMSKGVSRHFNSKMFGPFAHSYKHAHKALPQMLSHLKNSKLQVHKPLPIIEKMFMHFSGLNVSAKKSAKIFIVTADKHAGKTTFIKELVASLKNIEINYVGFFAEGIWRDDGKRAGFNLVTLPQNIVIPLSNRENTCWEQHGPFRYNPKALAEGKQLLEDAGRDSIIIIDEIGKQELNGNIWAQALEKALNHNASAIVITVRKLYLQDVIEKWQLHSATIVDATTDCPEEIAKTMVSNNS